MAQNNAVAQAILAATQNPQIQAAMLLGSRMESNWSTSAVGDNGTSFGPFQIHLPAHPGVSAAQAEDPTWAVQYMLPAYTAGVSQVPASLWGSNPALAAATAAFHAERPKNMYSPSVYTADWNNYVLPALGGNSSAVASGSGGATNVATTAASLSSTVFGPIDTVLNSMYMGALMLFGLALMIGGAIAIFRGSLKTVPDAPTINVKVNTKDKNSGTSSPRPRATNDNPSPEPTGRRAITAPIRVSPRPTRASATRIKPAPRVVNAPKELAS